MSWPPDMKLVLVEWIDSNGTAGWHQYDDMLASVQKGMACKSVGWLLLDAADRISLVPNLAETGSVADSTTIPRVVILKITDLDPETDR